MAHYCYIFPFLTPLLIPPHLSRISVSFPFLVLSYLSQAVLYTDVPPAKTENIRPDRTFAPGGLGMQALTPTGCSSRLPFFLPFLLFFSSNFLTFFFQLQFYHPDSFPGLKNAAGGLAALLGGWWKRSSV